jgi:hypothetical protein
MHKHLRVVTTVWFCWMVLQLGQSGKRGDAVPPIAVVAAKSSAHFQRLMQEAKGNLRPHHQPAFFIHHILLTRSVLMF